MKYYLLVSIITIFLSFCIGPIVLEYLNNKNIKILTFASPIGYFTMLGLFQIGSYFITFFSCLKHFIYCILLRISFASV